MLLCMDKYPVRCIWCSEFVKSEVRDVCKEQGLFAKESLYHMLSLLSNTLIYTTVYAGKMYVVQECKHATPVRNVSYIHVSTCAHISMSVGELLMLTRLLPFSKWFIMPGGLLCLWDSSLLLT